MSIIISGVAPEDDVAPVISSAIINPNNPDEMILEWDSVVGQTYQVQYFDEVDEPSGSWQTLQTLSASHETTSALIDVESFPDARF